MFRKVFKRDRKGNLLDAEGNIVSPDDPAKFSKAVHLNDIHLERGMHCVDCHQPGLAAIFTTSRAPRSRSRAKTVTARSGKRRRCLRQARLPRGHGFGAAERRKSANQPLAGQEMTRIRVRDAEGARIPLFQRVTRDRKRKDEKGMDVDLKVGDIMQNSMVVPDAGGEYHRRSTP